MVLDVFSDGYFLCQITSSDWRGIHPGKWIEKDSTLGKEMNLRNDSFINYTKRRQVNQIMVIIPPSPIGYCSEIDEILDKIDEL